MISAFSAKVRDNEMRVLDDLKITSPSTKDMVKILKNIEVSDKKVLIVTANADQNVVKSARNICGTKATFVGEINVYDILNHDIFLVTADAVARLEEVYKR